ncbi:N-acetylmuramoyl-L-alanine amidase [Streptomyces sp. ADI96-02]|uniref:peptidoglycan-binding protein n=1 Tax=Streptomyces sp. ADI96-02 TaxID=1522760 RepID=UPI000F5561F5|nr:peptidoglycan-binding protein [Streptomyces sp. ADI96-02]RPK56252.1 N-acetylmuramoyl-L-alanine amidase [Streptomyces sp. ADI96-02]
MKLVTRAQLGWPASAAPSQSTARGVKVHYEGTPVSTKLLTDHNACITEWKNIRKSHLANKTEGYSDVAYNYAACPHGYLLEGRGLRKRTGANGNQALNQTHYAIVGLVGSSGLTEPPAPMLSAIRDGIDLLRDNGAGNEIKGHRDGYATACPGGPLYAWVKKGAPRPNGDDEPSTKPPAGTPKYETYPGASFFLNGSRPALGKKSPIFTAMGKRLVAVGCGRYTDGPGPKLGQADVNSYEAWQRKCGYTGAAAKWPPGKTTWDKLQVPK